MSTKQRPHTLEAERQAILDRMQRSRDEYRRLLHDEPGVHLEHEHSSGHQRHAVEYETRPADVAHYSDSRQIARFSGGGRFPRSAAMRWVMDHPLLCAGVVAAVVAIGPRRIASTAMKGGALASTLTLRNSPNAELVSRVISIVANYMQQRQP